MITTQGFDVREEDFQGSSPLSVPLYIVDNIVVRPDDCLKCQPTQR